MDKGLTLQPPAAEAAEVSRTWQKYLDEMGRLREQLQHGRREIELMQMDTAARFAEINTLLSRIGSR